MNESVTHPSPESTTNQLLGVLNPSLIRRVDEALGQVGDYGEVRLIVVKGRLRFIQIMQSKSVQE